MTVRRGLAGGGLALALMVCLNPTGRGDEVTLVPGATVKQAPGGRVRGQVQSESAAEVVVKVGANTVSVPTDQVASVRYDGQPPSLGLAEIREASGQLGDAAEQYKKAASESAAKPFIEQAARFKQAEVTADLALTDTGKTAEATGLLDAFLKAHPAGRHTAAAWEALARLQLQKGDTAGVEKTVAEVTKLPGGEGRAGVLRSRLFARQGDHAKAIAELDRIIQAAPEGSARRRDARLARAESLAASQKYPEAETELNALIQAAPAEDAAAQSVAYNTLGDCLKAANRPKEALLAYLHTDLLYAKDKGQHPRALAQIAQLWRQLNRPDRADEALQRLKKDYPQSPWLQAATTGAR